MEPAEGPGVNSDPELPTDFLVTVVQRSPSSAVSCVQLSRSLSKAAKDVTPCQLSLRVPWGDKKMICDSNSSDSSDSSDDPDSSDESDDSSGGGGTGSESISIRSTSPRSSDPDYSSSSSSSSSSESVHNVCIGGDILNYMSPYRLLSQQPCITNLSNDDVSVFMVDLTKPLYPRNRGLSSKGPAGILSALRSVSDSELEAALQVASARYTGYLPLSCLDITSPSKRFPHVLHRVSCLFTANTIKELRLGCSWNCNPHTSLFDTSLGTDYSTLTRLILKNVKCSLHTLSTKLPQLLYLQLRDSRDQRRSIYRHWHSLPGFHFLVDLSLDCSLGHLGGSPITKLFDGMTRLQRLSMRSNDPMDSHLCTALCSLSGLLSLTLTFHLDAALGSDALHHFATQVPGLQCLCIDVAGLAIPAALALHSITTSHDVIVPVSDSTTHLTLFHNRHQPYPLVPRPVSQNLCDFSGSCNELPSVIDSPLISLCLTPYTNTFLQSHKIGVIQRLQQDEHLLAQLTSLVSIPDHHQISLLVEYGFIGWERGADKLHLGHSEFFATLIAVLALRPKQILRYVVIFHNSIDNADAINVLGKILSLEAVTLVGSNITIDQLEVLVRLPRMEVIELFAVPAGGLSKQDVESLRTRMGPNVRNVRIVIRAGFEVLTHRFSSKPGSFLRPEFSVHRFYG